jgi:hypothetical protein
MDFLLEEYKELIKIINNFDDRILIIKSWSISFTLATLAVAVQKKNSVIILLDILASFCFWILEAETKYHQIRYYYRMRDIEVLNSTGNNTPLKVSGINVNKANNELRNKNALRIDWSWEKPSEHFASEIKRREEIKWYEVYGYIHIMIPHILVILFCVAWILLRQRRKHFDDA